jgi:hypothetical protein
MQDQRIMANYRYRFSKRLRTAVFILAAGLALPPFASAGGENVATVAYLQGTLSVRHADGSRALLAAQSIIREQDVLRTEANSYARVKFADRGEIALRADSEMAVERYRYNEIQPEAGSAVLRLIKGGLRRLTGLIGKKAPQNEVLTTPVATIGIRGTDYGVLVCRNDCARLHTIAGAPLPDGLHVDVTEGSIAVKNQAGETLVGPGQFAFVRNNATLPELVPKAQGVQIADPPAIVLNSPKTTSSDINSKNEECSIQ